MNGAEYESERQRAGNALVTSKLYQGSVIDRAINNMRRRLFVPIVKARVRETID